VAPKERLFAHSKSGGCGLLQRMGLRPTPWQAEKNIFTGKASKNMI
jgi:hypothetical protein